MPRKFYKTLITLEVLSEDPIPPWMELPAIIQEASEGSFSATIRDNVEAEVTGKEMAALLQDQASDPEFFQLDAEGNDLSEDEDEQ